MSPMFNYRYYKKNKANVKVVTLTAGQLKWFLLFSENK